MRIRSGSRLGHTLAVVSSMAVATTAGCGDDDASSVCGNGVVERGEDCDGNCPESCDDDDTCTIDSGAVSAATCTLQCEHVAISVCEAGDDCCPSGCTRNDDADCPYYVDATLGDDANDGITPETAWQTAARVSAEPLGPGDRVAFKRGEVWRETFAFASSGSAERPIIISHYGDADEPPTFLPTQIVEGWTATASQLFSAALAVEPVQVMVDGERLGAARHPDQGYLYVDEDEDPANLSSFVDNDLTVAATDLVGATVLMRAERWYLGVGHVASFADHRVTLDAPLTAGRSIRQNVGYVLTAKLWMLDSPGEWFHDASTGTLYVRLTDDGDPADHRVEVAAAESGISIDAAHVVFDGLAVRAAGAHGIELTGPEDIRIRSCRVDDVGRYGIFVDWPPAGGVVAIEDNTIHGANFTGIMVSADTDTPQQVAVRGNRVEDTAPAFPLVGGSSDAVGYGWGFGMGLHVYGHGVEVQGNTVVAAGYSCLALSGANLLVSQNRLERCCLLFDDGGGIYLGGSGHLVRENTVIDSLGNAEGTPTFFTDQGTAAQGIYADDDSHDIVIEANTVVNADLGVQLHNTQNDQVHDNTIYASRGSGIHVSENGNITPGFCRDNRIERNVVFALEGVPAVRESYDLGRTVDYASYDQNRYWHQEGHKPFVRSVSGATSSYDVYSLDEWRAATGYDGQSIDLATSYQVVPMAGRPTGPSNLLANGTFDSSIDGWSSWPDAVAISWNGDCGLTGGCLSATAAGAGAGALVSSPAVAIVAGQGYLLRFSVRATTPQSLSAVVRRSGTPYDSLGLSAPWSAGPERMDYRFPFVATTGATGRLDLTSNADFAFLLDDVDLREAQIFENDPADDTQILINSTETEQSVELGGATFCDLDDQQVSGAVVVPPFSSRILTSCLGNNDAVCNNHETAASCAHDCP